MVFLLIVVLISLVYYYCDRHKHYWKDRNIPSPNAILFFGNLKESALRTKHIGIVYHDVYNAYPKEKIVGINRLGSVALLLRDLDIIKHVLIKDFDTFPDRSIEFSKKHLGDNLFHCDVKVWRELKDKLTTMFTAKKLMNITAMLEDCGDRFLGYMEGICDKPMELEMYYHFKKYTIATIAGFSFGLDINAFKEGEVFDQMDKDLFTTTYKNELDMFFPGILKNFNIPLFPESVDKFCHKIVEAASKERNGMSGEENNLIEILLALKDKTAQKNGKSNVTLDISEKLMAAQVFIFFIAGYGSNTSTLSFMMFRLAQNPDVQEKLIKEIDEVLEKYEGKITYDALKDLVYLDKVFHETLRMNPLTNSITRQSVSDYKLPGTDVTISKGTTVIISPYAIQRDEKYYPNPMKFDPERFAPENSGVRHSCAYLPFGNGPRACLGRRFAKMQAAMCVVKLLSRFKVEPSASTQDFGHYDPYRMFIFPKRGIYVKLIPRT